MGEQPAEIDWLRNDEDPAFNAMSLLRSISSSSSSRDVDESQRTRVSALSASNQDCAVPMLLVTPPLERQTCVCEKTQRTTPESGKLGADLCVAKSSRSSPLSISANVCDGVSVSPFLYLAQPPRVTAQLYNAVTNECFFFRAKLREREVHALADTGASENFLSEELVRALGLCTHQRKTPLWIKIANGEKMRCDQFARVSVRIGTWRTRMAFVILPGGPTMILGMPFFLRTEPQIKWKDRVFVVHDGATTHILRAELLTAAEKELAEAYAHVEWDAKRMVSEDSSESEASLGESDNPADGEAAQGPVPSPKRKSVLLRRKCLVIADPSEDSSVYVAQVSGMALPTLERKFGGPVVEPTRDDRREIEALLDRAADRLAHGKPVPKPSEVAQPEEAVPEALQALLREFADVFPEKLPLGLPVSRETDHTIDLEEGARPPAHRIYRMSPSEEVELRKQIAVYLAAGQIEPARSPFGAGVLFAQKKDGTKRLCIDYRALNKLTLKDKYPIPRIDELLDNMAGAQYFTKIDLQQGYHQIRVKPEHVPRTAFQTKFGSFQFRVMPFGLTNAPATFQRTMNNLLSEYREFANVYIDDIVIFSRTLEEHLQHVRKVLQKLRGEKLYAKKKKCTFGASEIEFCGFLVNRTGIGSHPDKLRAVDEWPTPKSAKDVRSFLGLAGFYQRFVKNFANIAAPLTALLKKTAKWSWTDTQQKAFEDLKKELHSSTELTYPDFAKDFILHMDASADALGATLSQEDSAGHLKLLTCTSRKLIPAERNYPTHEREMLALVHALKKWRHYLLGSRVRVFTDNAALRYWRTAQNLSPRQIRWLAYIGMFDLEIAHIPGKTNTAADALSRLAPAYAMPIDGAATDDWKEAYRADAQLRSKWLLADGSWTQPDAYHNGRIWVADRVLVPASKIREVLRQHHGDVTHGHWGARKTYDLVARKFHFQNMKAIVAEFVRTCPECQRAKPDRRGEQGELHPLPLPTRKWQSISMDWVVALPSVMRNGQIFDAVLTVTDRATRMVHLIPTNAHATSEITAELLLWHVFRLHGLPRSFISDRDPRLCSEIWALLCEKLDIKHHHTTAYHPQANGLAERTNQTMKQLLRIAHLQGSTWYDVLPLCEMAMNNAALPNSHATPFMLNYGFHPCCEADLFNLYAPAHDQMEQLPEFLQRMHRDWCAAYEIMQGLSEDMKTRVDQQRRPAEMAQGDQVLVNIRRHPAQSLWADRGPLMPYFAGPFEVVRRVSPNAYQLRLPPEVKSRIHDVFNVSQLRKYHSNTPLLDAREAAAQPGEEHDEAQVMAPDEPDDVMDVGEEAVVMPDPTVPVATDEESVHAEPMRRRRQLFADRQVMRTLFVNYCEARERLDMAREDFDWAHDSEDVMLRPEVFQDACSALSFYPTVDLFANAQHHQVPRYMAPRSDTGAVAIDAFAQDWKKARKPYANPPWSFIAQVLEKVKREKVRIMMVIPDWRAAPWYAQWDRLCVRSIVRTDPVFLDDLGQVRRKPWWNTRIGVLDGSR